MKVNDVIEYAEFRFNCQMGDYGKYADMSGKRMEYVCLERDIQASTTEQGHMIDQHVLCCSLVNQLGHIADKLARAGFAHPALYWRYAPKVVFEHSDSGRTWIRTRVYIENCNDYGQYVKKFAPTILRLAVDNVPVKPLLTLQDPITDSEVTI